MICQNCHLYLEATKQCIPTGSTSPLIYFVGEAPGHEEDAEGIPFIGRSGKLLRSTLAEMGINENDCRIFNIVRCIPRNGSGVRAPSDEEKECCHSYLFADIIKTNPGVIVTLGNSSSSYILQNNGYQTISKSRGHVFESEFSYIWNGLVYKNNFKVIPTFHPSYLLRNGCKEPLMNQFKSDIKCAYETALPWRL